MRSLVHFTCLLVLCASSLSTAFVLQASRGVPISLRGHDALSRRGRTPADCMRVSGSRMNLKEHPALDASNVEFKESFEARNVCDNSRRDFLSRAAQVGAATALLLPKEAFALGNPFQSLTDECEVDACINRDRRVFQRAGRKFTIAQEFDKNGSKSTGSALWEGDFVLTKYMETNLPEGFWKGKRVLELGAGTGLASMVAAILGAEEVLLTDGDSKVLELAEKNLAANLSPEEAKRIKLQQLRWEWAADPAWKLEGGGNIDVVLAADLTYYSDNIPPLMRMMQAISSTPTLLLLTHTVRPTDGDSMQQFYSAFDVEKIASGPAFEGHKETFLYSMHYNQAKKLPDVAEDGCKPGYVKNKQLNLCVPKQ